MSRRWIPVTCCWLFLAASGGALAEAVELDDLLEGLPVTPSGLTACDVQLGPGMGMGAPGSGGHPVALLLANTSPVASLALDVVDTPDLLTATGCTSLVPGFDCALIDSTGSAAVMMTSPSSASIPANLGPRPVAELLYSVAAGAPSGTIALDVQNAVVVDEFSQGCAASGISGSFLVNRCGDGNLAGSEACDDGNETNGDCCSSTCQPETCNDGSACTADSCVPGSGCLFDPAPFNGTSCGDPTSGPCNNADVCVAGVCDPGLSPVGILCGDMMSTACNAPDSCNAFGVCSPNLAAAGSACGDPTSNACTAPDACNGLGACLAQNAPAGTPCDDGLFCTGSLCDGLGSCGPGPDSPDCSDGIACTVDACDESADQCTHTPTDVLCDDGLTCTGIETCDALLGCQAGMAITCPPDGVACTLDACVEPDGNCASTPQNELCGDDVFCNGVETCDPSRGCLPGEVPCPPEECDESTDTCGAPDNDTCLNSEPVQSGSVTSGSTLGASVDGAPLCGTSNTAPGVWFSVLGNGTTLTASTCETVGNPPGSADYDSKISVFCPSCNILACVGGNDDVAGCNFHSAVSWCSQSGVSYLILVHGFGGATGDFSLSVSSNGTACAGAINCLPPPPTGACCLTSEPPYVQGEIPIACQDSMTGEDCLDAGGVYQGDDSVCTIPIHLIDQVVNPGLPIPDNTSAGLNSVMNVAVPAFIEDLNVDLGITHSWISDLVIQVTSPAGTTQVLWNQVCGSTDNLNATADDSGTETFCAPMNAGPIDEVFFPPELTGKGPLSVFNGEIALGNWSLNVSDRFAGDFGVLNQWSLHILEGEPVCAPVTCPTGGGDGGGGGGGGGGGEDDDADEDEGDDEDGDSRWGVVPEGQSGSTAPFALSERQFAGEESDGTTELLGWRLDGSELLFRTLRPSRSTLFAVDPATGAKRTLYDADVAGWFSGSGLPGSPPAVIERVVFGWRDPATGRFSIDLIDGITGAVTPISRSACSPHAALHEPSGRLAYSDCSAPLGSPVNPTVVVRDLRSGFVETWSSLEDPSQELSWSPDGSRLAAASRSGVSIIERGSGARAVAEEN